MMKNKSKKGKTGLPQGGPRHRLHTDQMRSVGFQREMETEKNEEQKMIPDPISVKKRI